MDGIRKLIEAAKAVATSHQFHHYSLLADVDALRAAIPAAEAELAGMRAVVKAAIAYAQAPGHYGMTINERRVLTKAVRALLASLPAPPSEPEENEDGDTRQPIGNCPTCGIPIYTDEGFCGVCGRR